MEKEHSQMHDKKEAHISSYYQLGVVLVILLSLTFLSVFVASHDFGAFSVAVALLVATIKGSVVLTYFMHLKYESRFIQWMVFGVFLLFAIVIIITFIDYLFR